MKLHLGCGKRQIPGYIHIDVQPYQHVDIIGSVDRLPFSDGSAQVIYACHVLEHFGRHEYLPVLEEWYRVLGVGGVLRLSVPDFKACSALYYEEGLEDGLSGLIGLIMGGQRDAYDFHKMIYDENFLRSELLRIGFVRVRLWDWKCTEHAHVDDYSQAYIPHMDKQNGRLMSLNIEAVR